MIPLCHSTQKHPAGAECLSPDLCSVIPLSVPSRKVKIISFRRPTVTKSTMQAHSHGSNSSITLFFQLPYEILNPF